MAPVRSVAMLAVVVGLLASCAVPSPSSRRVQDPAWDQTRSTIAADPSRAEAALGAYLSAHPRGVHVGDAALELAELRVASGDSDGAGRALRRALEAQPRGSRVDEVRLALARIERSAGRSDAAYRVASAIRPSRLPPADRAEAYRLLADVAASRQDREGQLRWLGQLSASTRSGIEREATNREIDALLSGFDVDALLRLAEQLDRAPPADRLWMRLARRRLATGDLTGAEEALAMAGALAAPTAPQGEREELAARVAEQRDLGPQAGLLPRFEEVARLEAPGTEGARGTLGVVLPLSGAFGRFGEMSLRGVMQATGVFSSGGEGVRLVVRDSRGDARVAADAVRELASDPAVLAIVGPLLAGPAEAAAEVAEAAGVPLLALTAREGVASGRDHVFRLALTPHAEMEALADHAIRNLGLARFAILHPRDSYGRGLKNLFWDAVEARGAEVVGVARYEPDDTDFKTPIRRLTGYLLLDDEQRAALKERKRILNRAKRVGLEEAALLREEAALIMGPEDTPLPPIVDFDALFIADAYEEVGLIAPQLAYHEVTAIQLLGPSGWNHPDLIEVGGYHVEGAVFTESFFAAAPVPFVREFSDRYTTTFREGPRVLAAQAFDATNLVMVQLARGLERRDEIREGLLGVRGYPGVSGVTTILPDGNAKKRPFLLGVRAGQIVYLD